MDRYTLGTSILRRLPPELAHRLGLLALRAFPGSRLGLIEDPWTWRGLCFRNRVGLAAGFDKNAVALRGVESLGAGFIEVGTILVKPWPGNDGTPRIKRMPERLAIWNRLGFPSAGLAQIKSNLQKFPRPARNGLLVACNIGPHPAGVKAARDVSGYMETIGSELLELTHALFDDADFFVVNLSSPNTAGLRDFLYHADLAERVFLPVKRALRRLDAESRRPEATPLLVKLPPEDSERACWTSESLAAVVSPLLQTEACDGFTAVNTSSRLAAEFGEQAGGISGEPLRTTALDVLRLLRNLIGPDRLIIGSGGLMDAGRATEFLEAGSDLVEIYSGLVHRGPRFIPDCAAALREHAGNRASGRL